MATETPTNASMQNGRKGINHENDIHMDSNGNDGLNDDGFYDDNNNEMNDDDFDDNDDDFNDNNDDFNDDDNDWDDVELTFDRQASETSNITKLDDLDKIKKQKELKKEQPTSYDCQYCGFTNNIEVKPCFMCKDDPEFSKKHGIKNKNDDDTKDDINQSDTDSDSDEMNPYYRYIKKLCEMFPKIHKTYIKALFTQKCRGDINFCTELLLDNSAKLEEFTEANFPGYTYKSKKTIKSDNTNGHNKVHTNGNGNGMENDDDSDNENNESNENNGNNSDNELFNDGKDDRDEAQKYKLQGNGYVKMKDYNNAIKYYTMAIERLSKSKKIELNDDDYNNLCIYYSNRALCYISLNDYDNGINDCNNSLKYNSSWIKSYWRRAQCWEHKNEPKRAIMDYAKIQKIAISRKDNNSITIAKNGIKKNQAKISQN